ncbi:class I SAM-dependent methyltransferase [Streptomyces sp. UNOB3_S3]|nr:class I SAM-dependent methyltransferase [Streptomyces sp. UNOB3_S3]
MIRWTAHPVVPVRARLGDEVVQAAVKNGVRQVVSLAAGLESRVLRLELPTDLVYMEVDLPALLEARSQRLAQAGAAALWPGRCGSWKGCCPTSMPTPVTRCCAPFEACRPPAAGCGATTCTPMCSPQRITRRSSGVWTSSECCGPVAGRIP